MYILGIHPIGHDTSACLIKDGNIIVGIEEERLTKKKHSTDFPFLSINHCLEYEGINIDDIEVITLSGDYNLQVEKRYLEFWRRFYPKNIERIKNETESFKFSINLINFVREKLNFKGKIFECHHHSAHFASAYHISDFEESSLFSIDGVGDYESIVYGYAEKNKFKIFDNLSVTYPHSIGLVYTAITAYLGFIPHCDEGKVMGLAPYGDYNKYYSEFKKIVKISDNTISIDLDYFDYPFIRGGNVSKKFVSVFGKKRDPKSKITKKEMDIAAALQKVTEDALIYCLNILYEKTKCSNLSLAGGVALNCVANGKILEKTPFKKLSIQPAAGDNGTSLGSSLFWYFNVLNKDNFKIESRPKLKNAYIGPEYNNSEIKEYLIEKKIKFSEPENIFSKTAEKLKKQKIIAWFNGRMEFGPRSLGNRSILSAPYPAEMKDILNLRVKKRESFRPFAPAILYEKRNDYFSIDHDSPHMLLASKVIDKMIKNVPAITHVDKTARIQTVRKEDNENFYNLIKEFEKQTDIPVLLNTSFNRMGQPICLDYKDALNTFFENDIDYLIINAKFFIKNEK